MSHWRRCSIAGSYGRISSLPFEEFSALSTLVLGWFPESPCTGVGEMVRRDVLDLGSTKVKERSQMNG